MTYDITIGIPTYNRSNLLPRAIESALAQENVNVEVIISDNNSSDDTAKVVGKYAQDPRVKYIKNSFNIGPVANYNQCLNKASGKFFMILGDDDWLSENYCKILVNYLEREDAVFLGMCIAISPDGAILNKSFSKPFDLPGLDAINCLISKDKKLRRHANFMLAARTQSLRDVDGFPNTDAAQHSDNMLLLRLLLTRRLFYDPLAVNYYSVYPNSYGNCNIPAVAIASAQYIDYWDRIISPSISASLSRFQVISLRRKLINSVSLLYIDRVIRYGKSIPEKLKLLAIFPNYSWLFSALLSPSLAKTVARRLGFKI